MKGIKCKIRKIRGNRYPLYAKFSENIDYVTLISSKDYNFPEIDIPNKNAPPVLLKKKFVVGGFVTVINAYPIIDNNLTCDYSFGGCDIEIDANHYPDNLIEDLIEFFPSYFEKGKNIFIGLYDFAQNEK